MTTSDSCCFICRSGTGICLTKYQCDHHREARREQDEEDRNYNLGYSDPTGNAAVRNAMRAQRRAK